MKEKLHDFFEYFNFERFVGAFFIACIVSIILSVIFYYMSWYSVLVIVWVLGLSLLFYHIM